MVLVWQITDNLPNFPPAKLSRYTVLLIIRREKVSRLCLHTQKTQLPATPHSFNMLSQKFVKKLLWLQSNLQDMLY